MSIDEIIGYVKDLGDVLTLTSRPGDGSPEISWGDVFFYHSPDGTVPKSQPFATIVTKDYPGDQGSRLDRPDAFRVNVAAGAEQFARWTGHGPREPATGGIDPSTPDVVFAHPVYGGLGWLCVVNPGPRTEATVRELLREAHRLARTRTQRRSAPGAGRDGA